MWSALSAVRQLDRQGRYREPSLTPIEIFAIFCAVFRSLTRTGRSLSSASKRSISDPFRMFSTSFPLFHGEGRLPVGTFFGD
ncbi:hypothetical protein ED857_19610 [Acinetobacter baumannii]|nr:hypothetical protein ED857_19610 [Acinetobacter baumannii]